MADVAKLKKQLQKKIDAASEAREKLNDATDAFAVAVAEHAIAKEAVEQAEALETALELRAKKSG
jgi:predicted metal-binding transcription factor (methanogenesis marker protein 9)